jgi:hypothetical protein
MKVDRNDIKRAVIAEINRMNEDTAEHILSAVTVEELVDDVLEHMTFDEDAIIESYVYEYLKTDANVDALRAVKNKKTRKN